MRISDNTISNNFLFNVNANRLRVDQLQIQLASGKKISKPSDNPIDADTLLRIKELTEKNSQYELNIESASGYLTATSNAMEQSIDIFQSALETITQSSSPAAQRDLTAYADKIDALLRQFVQVANSDYNGKYLFAGGQTRTLPYTMEFTDVDVSENFSVERVDTVNYNGDDTKLHIPVGDGYNFEDANQIDASTSSGVITRMNINGIEAFGNTESDTRAFEILIEARDALDTASFDGVRMDLDTFNSIYGNVREMLTQLISRTGEIGNSLEKLDILSSRLTADKENLESLRTVREDTDVAYAVTELQKQQVQLEAAYKMGANILPKSLVDFLR
jgi:flagellar hook-associated protein 3 FlgL